MTNAVNNVTKSPNMPITAQEWCCAFWCRFIQELGCATSDSMGTEGYEIKQGLVNTEQKTGDEMCSAVKDLVEKFTPGGLPTN